MTEFIGSRRPISLTLILFRRFALLRNLLFLTRPPAWNQAAQPRAIVLPIAIGGIFSRLFFPAAKSLNNSLEILKIHAQEELIDDRIFLYQLIGEPAKSFLGFGEALRLVDSELLILA